MAFDSLQPPDNFLPAVPDPFSDIRKGIAEQNQVVQQNQQMAQQQAFVSDLHALPQNPKASDIAGLLQRNPTQAAAIKGLYDTLAPIEQDAKLSVLGPIHAAMLSGAADVVQSRIGDAAASYDNANRPQDAAELRNLGQLYASNPRAAITTTGAGVASLLGREKYAENFDKFTTLPADLAKKEADTKTAQAVADNSVQNQTGIAMRSQYDADKARSDASTAQTTADFAKRQQQAALNNIQSEINSRGVTNDLAKKKFDLEENLNKVNIDKAKLEMGTPPAEISNKMSDLSAAYNKAMMNAKTADDLAAKIPKILTGFAKSGAPATVDEAIKAAAGSGDQATVLRKQLTQFITEEMLSKLPPGAARSPEMLATIKGGFANANASADVLIPMLQTAAQQQRQAAATAKFQKNWLGLNRSPGAARVDFPINGLQVKAGEDPDEILQNKVLPQITGPSAAPSAKAAAAALPPDRVAAIKTMTPAQIAARRAEIAAIKKGATS